MYQENIQIQSLNNDDNLNNNTVVISRNSENLSWLEIRKKSVKQFISLIAPSLLLIGSGINFVWNSRSPHLWNINNINMDEYIFHKHLASILWLIGGIIGVNFAAILVHKIRKIIIYGISCAALLVNGILFIALFKNSDALFSGLIFGGFSYGLAFVTAIIHASEISIKQLRGWFITGLVFSITIGILIISFACEKLLNDYFINRKEFKLNPERLTGILNVILASLSIFFLPYLTEESPAFLIEQHNNALASKTLLKLRKETLVTYETQQDFAELQEMVNNSNNNSSMKFSIFQIIAVILLRLFSAICMYMNIEGFLGMLIGIYITRFPMTLLSGFRAIGVLISMMLIDILGRKKLLIISTVISAIIICGLGFIDRESIFIKYSDTTKVILGLSALIFQLFIGFGWSTVSTTYLTEIFPFKYKSYLIAFTIIVENAIYIILEYSVQLDPMQINIKLMCLLFGALEIIICFFSVLLLPETKNLSLNKCLEK